MFKKVLVIVLAIILFAIFVPVAPVWHTSSRDFQSSSWPDWFGSVTYSLFRFGIIVTNNRNIIFSMGQ